MRSSSFKSGLGLLLCLLMPVAGPGLGACGNADDEIIAPSRGGDQSSGGSLSAGGVRTNSGGTRAALGGSQSSGGVRSEAGAGEAIGARADPGAAGATPSGGVIHAGGAPEVPTTGGSLESAAGGGGGGSGGFGGETPGNTTSGGTANSAGAANVDGGGSNQAGDSSSGGSGIGGSSIGGGSTGGSSIGGSSVGGSSVGGSSVGGSSVGGSSVGGGGGMAERGTPLSSYTPTGDPIALASVVNASDIAWKPSTDTFFVLANKVSRFYEYGSDFASPHRVIELANPPRDAEGLTYLGANGDVDRFAFAIESPDNLVWVFDLASDATSLDFATAVRQRLEPIAPSRVLNRGLEGIAYRPPTADRASWFYVCEEGEPGQEPIRLVSFEYNPTGPFDVSYRDGSLMVAEPWSAAEQFGALAGDLSGLHYDTESDTLLVVSDRGSRLLRVAPESGEVLDQLLLIRSPQYEGVTLASGGRLVLVSEPNFIEVWQRK